MNQLNLILKIRHNEELIWRGNIRILSRVFSTQKIDDMLSSNHHLSLYTKLITVLNKEDWQSMK